MSLVLGEDSVDLISCLKTSLNRLKCPLGELSFADQQDESQSQFYVLLVSCLQLKLQILDFRREQEIHKTVDILRNQYQVLNELDFGLVLDIKKYRILGLLYDQVAKDYLRLTREKKRLKMDLIRLAG